MARTASTMLALGTTAPDFSLPDVVSGKTITRDQAAGPRGLLVMFLCAHCPFVQHVNQELGRLGRDYAGRGLGIVAISSNDAETYPDDGPEGLRRQARKQGFQFPYLFDETQEVAHAYEAACTPDFFLFDADKKLVYRGQLDASRPENGVPVDGRDLRAAVDQVLAGKPVAAEQKPSIGCNIKWKQNG
ncbi:MAG: thioredoxin family protein [Acidobacteriaceae bacterium]